MRRSVLPAPAPRPTPFQLPALAASSLDAKIYQVGGASKLSAPSASPDIFGPNPRQGRRRTEHGVARARRRRGGEHYHYTAAGAQGDDERDETNTIHAHKVTDEWR